ncbi:MAG: hypothetical protein IT340_17295 [Chloroflexi bacterium]|nr:hypothetical protein [Chloroflexota bacterium]
MTTPSTNPAAALADRIPNVSQPLPGVMTAGQPQAEDFARVAGAGFTTVLDVCAPEEERGFDEPTAVAAAGLDYIVVPVRSYTPDDAVFDAARAVLSDSARRPLFFHCRSANRVGGLLLAFLMLDEGLAEDQALRLAVQVGLRNETLAGAALDYVRRRRALA